MLFPRLSLLSDQPARNSSGHGWSDVTICPARTRGARRRNNNKTAACGSSQPGSQSHSGGYETVLIPRWQVSNSDALSTANVSVCPTTCHLSASPTSWRKSRSNHVSEFLSPESGRRQTDGNVCNILITVSYSVRKTSKNRVLFTWYTGAYCSHAPISRFQTRICEQPVSRCQGLCVCVWESKGRGTQAPPTRTSSRVKAHSSSGGSSSCSCSQGGKEKFEKKKKSCKPEHSFWYKAIPRLI